MKILLKGGMIVSSEKSYASDVLIDGEKIVKIAENIECEDCEIYDVSGKLLFPGFIDAHTHLDLTTCTNTSDNFYTGTKAAIAGGTTCILDFGTQYIGETLPESLENWHKKADGKASCDYGFHMSISEWNEQTYKDVETMFKEGVTSFKLYMAYDNLRVSDAVMYDILKRVKELGGIVGTHCENGDMVNKFIEEYRKAGKLTPEYHPLSRPPIVEAEAVYRYLSIASLAEAPVVVVHLSTEMGYKIIEDFRKKGNKVYIETCPQYLLMNDRSYITGTFDGTQNDDKFAGAKFVMSPPLRKPSDQECLWNGLKDNSINTIATDHCSFNYKNDKEMGREDFSKIPNGGPGVEHRPVLMYTYGVREGRITKEQMTALLSENPAKLYGLYPNKGIIAEGSDADIVVWNPEAEWVIKAENQLQNCDYTPYENLKVKGIAEKVFLRGMKVAENGNVEKELKGKYIHRNRTILL